MRTNFFMSWHYADRITPLCSNFQYLPTSRANYCLIILIYISYLISLSMVNPCNISHTVPSVIASIYFTSLFIVGHLTFQSYNCSIHCCFHVISQMRSSPSFNVSPSVRPSILPLVTHFSRNWLISFFLIFCKKYKFQFSSFPLFFRFSSFFSFSFFPLYFWLFYFFIHLYFWF